MNVSLYPSNSLSSCIDANADPPPPPLFSAPSVYVRACNPLRPPLPPPYTRNRTTIFQKLPTRSPPFTQLGRRSIPTTLAYDCPTAGKMADELLRTAPPSASPKPMIANNNKSAPPKTCVTRAVAVAPSHGVPSRAVQGGKGGDDDEARAGGEWEEERHLDNVLYLVYK